MVKWLEDDTFLFWLNFFSKVMPHVYTFANELEKIKTNGAKLQSRVDDFEKAIAQIKNDLPPLANESVNTEDRKKRRRLGRESLNECAREVCDILTSEVGFRFSFINHLFGAKLFSKQNYKQYRKTLIAGYIDEFCKAYSMIDKEMLKMEIGIFYSRKEITERGSKKSGEIESFSWCLRTLNFLTSLGLEVAFGEIVKVLKILVTIPMATSESERCFSTLESIKKYLKSTEGEDRLLALAMLSIEKSMVREIPNFNEKVMEKFISDKNRRMDFHFR